MRQTWDIPSELDSAEFSTCQVDELILSLAREIALERVRRRINPRVYQIYQLYQLYVEWGWTVGKVKRFLGVGAIGIRWAAFWVRLNVSIEMLRHGR